MTVWGYELSLKPDILNLGLIDWLQVVNDPPENICKHVCLYAVRISSDSKGNPEPKTIRVYWFKSILIFENYSKLYIVKVVALIICILTIKIFIFLFVSKDKEDESSDNDEVFHSIQAEVQIEPLQPYVPNPKGNEVSISV